MDDVEMHLREVLQEDALNAPVIHDLASGVVLQDRNDRRRWLTLVAAVAAGTVAIAGLGFLANGLRPESKGSVSASVAATGRSGPLPDAGTADCEPPRSGADVARRSFAFDGTITAVGASAAPDASMTRYATVTFIVNEWFKGGKDVSADVVMPAPLEKGQIQGETGPSYGVGSRLLVSGEGAGEALRAWGCGYTRYADATTSANWRAAIGGRQ